MKILITGATGYAGFYAAIALRQAGHQVFALVRDPSKPRAQNLQRYEVNLTLMLKTIAKRYCNQIAAWFLF